MFRGFKNWKFLKIFQTLKEKSSLLKVFLTPTPTPPPPECVSPPTLLPVTVYVSCVGCVLLMALFSLLQVYTNRLRRVIAAFYYPKREKRRILFIYNLQLHRRISSPDKTRTRGRRGKPVTVFQRLARWWRRLCRWLGSEDTD
uniref:Dendritic cell-specific transmembrane protein-like domain-containing protein n=1 Tax=Salarias fasciatus TaxID=181472 RepID=A0A672HX66_SALFA